jgi:hypothetical protein
MSRTEERIGKIERIRIGGGGYQDAMFGVSFTFSGKGWGVGTFEGTWSNPPSEHAQWTVRDQEKSFLDAFLLLKNTMKDAGVTEAHLLTGKPVMVTFEGNTLKSWRILTEAL